MSPVFNIRCMKFCLIVASDSTHVSRDGADTCSKTKLPKFQNGRLLVCPLTRRQRARAQRPRTSLQQGSAICLPDACRLRMIAAIHVKANVKARVVWGLGLQPQLVIGCY